MKVVGNEINEVKHTENFIIMLFLYRLLDLVVS